jgi:hypothetical protein
MAEGRETGALELGALRIRELMGAVDDGLLGLAEPFVVLNGGTETVSLLFDGRWFLRFDIPGGTVGVVWDSSGFPYLTHEVFELCAAAGIVIGAAQPVHGIAVVDRFLL